MTNTRLDRAVLLGILRDMGEYERSAHPMTYPRPGRSLKPGDVIWMDDKQWVVTSRSNGFATLIREQGHRIVSKVVATTGLYDWIRRIPRTTPPPLPYRPERRHDIARVLTLMKALGVTIEDLQEM